MSDTFHGSPHPRCGETLRYVRNGKCVACVATDGAARQARRTDRNGNYRIGVAEGFVRFGTLAHRILAYIHAVGPASHAEIVEEMPEEVGVSAILGRLVRHGLLYRVGRQSHKPGIRSGYVFSLSRPTAAELRPPTTARTRNLSYKAAQRLKVASVFDFRGSISL